MDHYRFYPSAFSGSFERAAADTRLLPTHVSLLAAILYFSQQEAPHNPFQVSRRKLMRFSRIRSSGTYHKCLRELIERGYIHYEPSWHPKKGSRIILLKQSIEI